MRKVAALVFSLVTITDGRGDDFSYDPPGKLVPDYSGNGVSDPTVYAPEMRFPLKKVPAFANSQVYGDGGSLGPKGSQCDKQNFLYPWHDNFCEERPGRGNPACPTKFGHEGQDIRPANCSPDIHPAVAAEDGRITKIGPYWVGLLGDSGIYYSYLHMNPTKLQVRLGDRVSRGATLGLVSDYMPNAHGTTTHLHFEIHANLINSDGAPQLQVVSPYTSLTRSYQRLLGGSE